jgi:hypothetical protein
MKKLTKKEIEYWRDKLTIQDLVVICDMKGFKLEVELDIQARNRLVTDLRKENNDLKLDIENRKDAYESMRQSSIKQIDCLASEIQLLKEIIVGAIRRG